MIRKLEKKDREEYLKMAHEFYHSPAVLHPIPDSYMEKTFDECVNDSVYAEHTPRKQEDMYTGLRNCISGRHSEAKGLEGSFL